MEKIRKDRKNSAVLSFIIGLISFLYIIPAVIWLINYFLSQGYTGIIYNNYLHYIVSDYAYMGNYVRGLYNLGPGLPLFIAIGLFFGIKGIDSHRKKMSVAGLILCGAALFIAGFIFEMFYEHLMLDYTASATVLIVYAIASGKLLKKLSSMGLIKIEPKKAELWSLIFGLMGIALIANIGNIITRVSGSMDWLLYLFMLLILSVQVLGWSLGERGKNSLTKTSIIGILLCRIGLFLTITFTILETLASGL